MDQQSEHAFSTGEIFEPEAPEEESCLHPVKDTTINLSTLTMHCKLCDEHIDLRTFVQPILRKSA